MQTPLEPVAHLLPHSGRMVMIDRLLHYDAHSAVTESDVDARHIFAENGALPAWAFLEIMAQAIGVLVGALAEVKYRNPPRTRAALASLTAAFIAARRYSPMPPSMFICRRKGRTELPMREKETVLVTGASRGIGRAIAVRLAEDGFNIVVHCRGRLDDAHETAAQVAAAGGVARVLSFDVSAREAVREALETDIAAHGAYYGIVLNAGLTRDGAFPALTGEDWDAGLRTNLDGFYNVLQPLIMPMIRLRRGGRIVAVSSVSGLIGNRGQVNYSASKAGLIGAVKALAIELGKRGITVNAVAPGLIETEMVEAHVPVAEIVKMIPLARAGAPDDVAQAVRFLMSAGAGYITRQVLSVNGGLC